MAARVSPVSDRSTILDVDAWQLARTPSLADDNGLFWRITQHAGAELLPNVSSHLLVSTHVFLELLHYGVWIVALPLIAPPVPCGASERFRLARHRRGWPKLIGAVLVCGLFLVALLWIGFSATMHSHATFISPWQSRMCWLRRRFCENDLRIGSLIH